MHHRLDINDTIAALASAPGPAERGVVRASGGDVRSILTQVFRPDDDQRWRTSKLPQRHPGTFDVSGLTRPLRVDVLLWPTKRSYTGEPLAEIHTIGSPPILEAGLAQLFAHGVRPARPGEFTLRAFLAGRIDLLQAEAVLGVIDADVQQELKVALGQLGGGLSQRIAALHEELLLHLADLEAGLDFVEEDIEFVSRTDLTRRLREGRTFIEELSAQSGSRLQTTGRQRVVLAGSPNVGKSTLFNALVGEERAIVSQVAGTTRDYVSAPLECVGVAIELIDTAGWDAAAVGISGHADDQRQQQCNQADLILWCTSAESLPETRADDDRRRRAVEQSGNPVVHVWTKCDRRPTATLPDAVPVSGVTGEGISELKQAIATSLQTSGADSTILGSTSARCRDTLRGALAALEQALTAAEGGLGDELIAVELRDAIDHLAQIAGRVYTDDILDRIFSRFCIGK